MEERASAQHMIGTIVNSIAVIVGSAIGLLVHSRLPERFTNIVFQGIGLFTVFLGVSMGLKTDNVLILVLSIVLGGLLGELINIEKGLNTLSSQLGVKFKIGGDTFSKGMITAFLLFCVGSLTILGAIEEGLGGKPNLLLTKSLMDFFSSIVLAAALGIGVMFSVIPLFLFQGGLTLLAALFGDFLNETIINEMTAVGGLLILGLGINLLDIKDVKVSNMLPALVVIVLLRSFF